MGRAGWGVVLLAGLAWVAAPRAGAQANSPTGAPTRPMEVQTAGVATDLAEALGRLAARAQWVFVGTVESIDRTAGVVEISLHVEQTLQGQPGSHYILREWAGRWPPGLQRYTAGQRSLFFLNAPGPGGLSSPVDGSDGVLRVFGEPGAGAVLDVERLNATLLRNVGDKLEDTKIMSLQAAVQTITKSTQSGRRPANPSGEEPVPIIRRGSDVARASGSADGAH